MSGELDSLCHQMFFNGVMKLLGQHSGLNILDWGFSNVELFDSVYVIFNFRLD